jgi:predicted TIM-barrel fold metal-dependent hydrolase
MIDMHVHYFPPAVFRAIWRYFESKSLGLWKIRYKQHTEKHIATLKSFGVTRFTTLLYAHKPGLADYLNEFIFEEAKIHPELIPFGTIYAGDGDVARRARRLFEEYNFAGIKLHPFVSLEQLDDPRFFSAYEIMQAKGKIVICHPGSGPVYDHTDGASRVENILREFPNLKIVIAHCGAFEYGDYPRLAREYPNVYFDTAMNCVHHNTFHNNCPGKNFFLEFEDRVLYGSDFPNIPYDYLDQSTSLKALQLGNTIERKIFTANAEKLLGAA